MKIIFFGTSEFAVPSLRKIIESSHELLAVVTQPDRKKGRHLRVAPSPVKAQAQKRAIPLYQPGDASGCDMCNILKKYDADIFVVTAFGQILKKALLEIPGKFCVNVHASLLPKYRGAAPVNYAIINGDRNSGVTTIKMNENLDGGDIILKRETKILKADTAQDLTRRLADIGADLLIETLRLIESGKARFEKQKESEATYAHKLKKQDGLIDWSQPARNIHDRIRGLYPWPGAYTYLKGRLLKICKSEFNDLILKKPDAGEIILIDKRGVHIATGKGELVAQELQLEGGRRLKADEFLRGHKLAIGFHL